MVTMRSETAALFVITVLIALNIRLPFLPRRLIDALSALGFSLSVFLLVPVLRSNLSKIKRRFIMKKSLRDWKTWQWKIYGPISMGLITVILIMRGLGLSSNKLYYSVVGLTALGALCKFFIWVLPIYWAKPLAMRPFWIGLCICSCPMVFALIVGGISGLAYSLSILAVVIGFIILAVGVVLNFILVTSARRQELQKEETNGC